MSKQNSRNLSLYERIMEFELDDYDGPFTFSQRLARENDWSDVYTQRVIVEYKRFLFLAVSVEHPVTPSDQVDQAWHLHLTYSWSYWEKLCKLVLRRPFHHYPTHGGLTEKKKFNEWYMRTLDSYKVLLGEPPPEDIWPGPVKRFGEDVHYQRVNTIRNWVISKSIFNNEKIARSLYVYRDYLSIVFGVLLFIFYYCGDQVDDDDGVIINSLFADNVIMVLIIAVILWLIIWLIKSVINGSDSYRCPNHCPKCHEAYAFIMTENTTEATAIYKCKYCEYEHTILKNRETSKDGGCGGGGCGGGGCGGGGCGGGGCGGGGCGGCGG